MPDERRRKNDKMREEYGYGYDLSPDDLDVIGQNDAAKKQNANPKETKHKLPKGDDHTYPLNPS